MNIEGKCLAGPARVFAPTAVATSSGPVRLEDGTEIGTFQTLGVVDGAVIVSMEIADAQTQELVRGRPGEFSINENTD